jgi:hypothetical protein
MDLREPGRAFSGSLTMPILRVLSARSTPASAPQVTRLLPSATEAGVRRALDRLSLHGLCSAEIVGGRAVYSLNVHHVLYRSVRQALDANKLLVTRLRTSFRDWPHAPLSATLYGSAARRDGDANSDIDLLLIRPALPSGIRQRRWNPDVHELRGGVKRWTGNALHVVDWNVPTLLRAMSRRESLLDNVDRDGVVLVGLPFYELRRQH